MPAAGFLPAVASPNANSGWNRVFRVHQPENPPCLRLALRQRRQPPAGLRDQRFGRVFLCERARGSLLFSESVRARLPIGRNSGGSKFRQRARYLCFFLKAAKNSAAGVSPSTISRNIEAAMPQSARDLVDSGKKRLYADKNPQKALSDFESAVAKAPGSYEAYYLIGMTYITLRRSCAGRSNP